MAGFRLTTADALHWAIDSQTLAATAYRPADNECFARARFQSSTWNGSWQTADFLTRRMNDHERWIGLYTEREAREAADDGFGSNFKEPDRVINEGAEARRRLWLATIARRAPSAKVGTTGCCRSRLCLRLCLTWNVQRASAEPAAGQ